MQRDIESYTQRYLAQDFSDFESYMVAFRRNKVLEFLAKQKPQNILEIGCGMESIAKYYKDYQSFSIVEPSKVFAQKAQEDFAQDNRVTIINDFIQPQVAHLKSQRFDCILLSSLLHEVENPKQFLSAILPLCPPPPTILHINVPNAHSFHLLWAYESGLISQLGGLSPTAKSLQQHTAFTLQSLSALVEEVGLEIIESGSYFLKPLNHGKMSLALQSGILDENLLRGLEKMVQYTPNLGAEIFVNAQMK
ncbi:methyltransferase domain-containing protein [Helicobacter sp. MIT 21-1697]|uniref:methyltransferase domain-containing protein n=1 Tax=Helicobacter sp. MIT 21-1697 TaxID=2993733 RepID=UPI00224B490B|nr:methyltransferase domain-containing protein [Helicobacter sp. MIT 21-1697]MCX2717886.1 methyltransferase domain-containing protein [Helicobacter sp. MIT 21-1697]